MRNFFVGGILVTLVAACGGGGGEAGSQPIPNRVPVANNQAVATDPGQDLNGTLTATDADGDALTFAIASMPTSGMVALSGARNAEFTYTPNAGFTGTDSFTFTAADAEATSTAATVTVNVNTKPAVAGSSYETSDIVAISGGVTGSDIEGDALTYAIATQPTKGTLSGFDANNGTFTYTPNANEDGADSFTITANDGFQTSDAATVAIEIFRWSGTLQFGSPADDSPTTTGLYQTADGGLVFGGSTDGQMGSTPNLGSGDAWLRKVDRRGNEVWTTQFGSVDDDNSRVLLPDPDGSGTFVISPRRIVDSNNIITPIGATVYKFDNDGFEQLNAPVDFQGVQASAHAYQGTVDGNGDVYILSWISNGSSLITKVDGANGATIWQRQLDGFANNPVAPHGPEWDRLRLRSIQADAAGNLVVSGFYWPAATAQRPCSTCAFIAVYSSAGNLLSTTELNDFAAACGRASEGLVYRVAVAPDQSLWVAGLGGVFSDDSFTQVAKLSADASTTEWTYCHISGARMSNVYTYPTFTANGDALIYAYILEFDPNSGDSISSSVALTRLAPDGTEVFRREVATTRADSSAALMYSGSVIEDQQGLLFLSGTTDGEFTPGANLGAEDAFILRLAGDGTVQ